MKKWAYAACTAALIVGTAQAAAAVLVVRSSGPSAKIYKTGKALPDNSKITLKANDTVTLLDSRGTRTLRGPGTFDVSASAGGSTSAIAALSGSNARRRTVGASRGDSGMRGTPTGATAGRNVWQADIARSGNVCMVAPSDVGLYRSDADTAETIAIRDLASNGSAQVEFAAGQRNASWPEGLPITAGHRYEVKHGKGAATLTAKALGRAPAGMEELAQSLIVNGCEAQLDVLVDTLTPPSAG